MADPESSSPPRVLLLKLQFVYCFLGIGYNLLSFCLLTLTGKALAPTPPLVGAAFIAFYGLCVLSGFKVQDGALWMMAYRFLMLLFVILIGYSGVLKHFFRKKEEYSSLLAWVLAVVINLFGVGLNLIAALGWHGG